MHQEVRETEVEVSLLDRHVLGRAVDRDGRLMARCRRVVGEVEGMCLGEGGESKDHRLDVHLVGLEDRRHRVGDGQSPDESLEVVAGNRLYAHHCDLGPGRVVFDHEVGRDHRSDKVGHLHSEVGVDGREE